MPNMLGAIKLHGEVCKPYSALYAQYESCLKSLFFKIRQLCKTHFMITRANFICGC